MPQSRPSKLIVVAAFDQDDEGGFVTAFGPAEQQSEDRAVRLAETLARKHAGVIAWARDADPDVGEYGPATVLFQSGDVPEME